MDLERQGRWQLRPYRPISGVNFPEAAQMAAAASLADVVMRSAGKRIFGPSSESNGKRTKSVKSVTNKMSRQMIMNEGYTPAMKLKKRKRKGYSTSVGLNKKQKASIKRMINSKSWVLTGSKQFKSFRDIGCAFNQVNYHVLTQSATPGSFLTTYRYNVRSGPDLDNSEQRSIDATNDLGEKIKQIQNVSFEINNNSNTSGEIRIALFKCKDYTNQTPLGEIQAMRAAAYSGVVPSVVDDHLQYFSVPGQRRESWKLSECYTINMKPGETSSVKFKAQTVVYDIDRITSEGSTDYVPGAFYVLARMVGRTSHYNIQTAAAVAGDVAKYSNQGTQAFRVDYSRTTFQKEYLLGHPDAVKVNFAPVMDGLYVPLASTEVVISADTEAADVGVPEQV